MALRKAAVAVCHFCKNMTLTALRQRDGYAHARTYEELETVLDCKICRHLWPDLRHVRESLERSVRLGRGKPANIFLRIEDSPAGSVLRAFLRQGNLRDDFMIEDSGEERIILVTALDGAIANETGLTWETDRMYTGSYHYISRAAKWVNACKDTHCCNISSPSEGATQRWPRRLLFLGHDDGAISLVPTRGGSQSPYATLSYCWGPNGLSDTAKTTVGSLLARETHIDTQTLPRTFQDAIGLCRKLGIEYLWIDALCIIQDSKIDWQTEGSNMGSIYRNSTITIAADSSEDAEGGLFYQLDPNDLAVEITLELADGRDAALILHPTSITSLQPKRAILQSRAWCFQERVLSPRILHFFDCGVLFECRQEYDIYNDPTLSAPAGSISRTGSRVGRGLGCSHEQYQSFLQDELMIEFHTTYLAMSAHQLRFYQVPTSMYADDLSPHLFLRPWFQTVLKDYTKRRLTFVSDKLMAISSTARELQHQTGATYLAGLWAEDIAFGLAWEPTERESIPSTDRDEPNAKPVRRPTWSWTSSDDGCNWPIYESDFKWWYPRLHQSFESHLTLVSHQVDLLSPDPFGQVSGGQLRVRGKAFMGSYTPSSRMVAGGTFDMLRRSWDGEEIGFPGVRTSFEGEEDMCLAECDTARSMDRLCLLLCSKDDERFFLALRKVEEPNVYEREHMFSINPKAKDSVVYEHFIEWIYHGAECDLVLI